MKTLLIYDETGFIYFQQTGTFRKPEGLKHLEVEIPEGKVIDSIKLDPKGDTVVFKDVPKSDLQLLQDQLETIQGAIDELLMGGAL